MKHFYIKGTKEAGASKIASLIAKEFLDFKDDASILIYKNDNEVNMDNHEVHDFIPLWDEMIVESVESVGFIDYLDIFFSKDSLDLSKEAFYESLKKLFNSYELVIINSNNFKFNPQFEEKSVMLLVVEPTEKSLDELSEISWSDRTHLVLNKYNSDSVHSVIRDKISDINLRLVAKFEDFTTGSEANQNNLHKIMHALDLVPGDIMVE